MAKETNIFLMEDMTVRGLCIAITNRDITLDQLVADLMEIQETTPVNELLTVPTDNMLDFVYAMYPKELSTMICQLLSNAAFKLKKDGNLLAYSTGVQESNS